MVNGAWGLAHHCKTYCTARLIDMASRCQVVITCFSELFFNRESTSKLGRIGGKCPDADRNATSDAGRRFRARVGGARQDCTTPPRHCTEAKD
jgi:hypothetical protein